MSALTQLAPDLWVASRPLPLPVGDIGTRMTIIRLPDGGLFLHSPVQLDAETQQALDAIGPVRCVVAPSKVHYFFVAAYGSAYPNARLFAAPGLAEKRPELRFDAVLDDTPPVEWRGAIDQHLFGGATAINEVVFFIPPAARSFSPTSPSTCPPRRRAARGCSAGWSARPGTSARIASCGRQSAIGVQRARRCSTFSHGTSTASS